MTVIIRNRYTVFSHDFSVVNRQHAKSTHMNKILPFTIFGVSLIAWSSNGFAIPVEQSSLSNSNASVRYIDSSPSAQAQIAATPVSVPAATLSQTADLQQQITAMNQRIAQQDGQIDNLEQEVHTLKQKLATASSAKKTTTIPKATTATKQAERAAAPVTTSKTATPQPTSAEVVTKNAKTSTTKDTPTKTTLTDKTAYNKAYEAYQQGGAAKAIAPMQAFIKQYPDSPYVSYAHYWLGEFNLAITPAKYTTSKQNFQKVLQSYPQSSKAPAALYRLIEISQNVDKNNSKAKQYYQQLLKDYPKSKEAQNAKNNLHLDKPSKSNG